MSLLASRAGAIGLVALGALATLHACGGDGSGLSLAPNKDTNADANMDVAESGLSDAGGAGGHADADASADAKLDAGADVELTSPYDCPMTCFKPCVAEPTHVFRFCPQCSSRPPGFWEYSLPIDVIAVRSSTGWGILDPQGRILFLSGFIDPNLSARWDDPDYEYFTQAEPYTAQSQPGTPQGEFISADATSLHGVVNDGDTIVLSDNDRNTGFSPRSRFVPVLSRSLDELFIVGGEVNGAPAGEILALSNPTQPLPVSVPPRTVLAATFSYKDGSLWFLDADTFDSCLSARLVYVDAVAGTSQVVFDEPRDAGMQNFWLRSDLNGDVLLFSSSASKHCTLRVSFDGFSTAPPVPTLMSIENGPLLGPPLVDPAGYEYVIRNGNLVSTTRVATLTDQSGGSPDVSQCL